MTEPEAIEAEARPLAIKEAEPPRAPLNLFGTSDPVEVVAKATRVADALKAVVVAKKLVANIQGKEYLTVEAWTTLGSMLGLYPFTEWSRPLEDGRGWEARVIVRTRDGVEIAAAEAMCTRDERSWKNRDDYALRSMAMTRAVSKAMRLPLGFIAVLSGFEPLPADEVPKGGFQDTSPARRAPAAREAPKRPPAEDDEARRKRGLAQIHILMQERGVSEKLYRELLMELWPEVYSDPAVEITAKVLSYEQLRATYAEMSKRTRSDE